MSYSKVVKVGPKLRETVFSIVEDSQILVEGVDTTTISLGLLLTSEDKREILDALACKDFMSLKAFVQTLGISDVTSSGQFGFTDLKFARKLKEIGLPSEYAFRTAYLTSLASVNSYDDKRLALWENFRNSKYDVKLEHREGYAGITSLDVYLALGLLSNCKIADAVLTHSISEPLQMIQLVRRISDLLLADHVELLESATNLNVLSRVFSETFPRRHELNRELIYPGIVKLLELDTPWTEANKLVSRAHQERLPLSSFINKHLGDYSTNTLECNVVAILNATYGEEVTARAEHYLQENASVLSPGGHMLLVLLAVLEYLKEDGSLDSPINWVVAASVTVPLDGFFRNAEVAV